VRLRHISLVVSVVSLCGICLSSYRVTQIEKQFELVADGAKEDDAFRKLGAPEVVETGTPPFFRYASEPCVPPCVRRLWWEHPILKGWEAWSVEISATGTILRKSHWVSP
jgi:hypothetical protein